jgi:hypothetical protein
VAEPATRRRPLPTIACVNHATVPLGVNFGKLVAVLQKYVDACFAPAWGTEAKLVQSRAVPRGAWGLLFLDDADAAGTLGYHDLTAHGLPLGKVFVKTTLKGGELVSVTASHELAELLIDPAMNMRCEGPKSRTYAYEAADPVEEESFLIDGVAVSNFVYPAWFEEFHARGSTRFDYLGRVEKPFQLLEGGYIPICEYGHTVWTALHGSRAKAKRHAQEDRRGHRSETRAARAKGGGRRRSRKTQARR